MTERISWGPTHRRDVLAKCNYRCHYCNRSGTDIAGPDGKPWHLDHMQPLIRGGEDCLENLTAACERCNMVKGARPYIEFVAFARRLFWVDADDALAEGTLNWLDAQWTKTTGSTWRAVHVDQAPSPPGRKPKNLVASVRDDEPGEWYTLARFEAFEEADVDWIAVAHEWLPRLTAEIRRLRDLLDRDGVSDGPDVVGADTVKELLARWEALYGDELERPVPNGA